MWRCKWIELQLVQLRSQELKYERELAAYDYRKQHEFADFTISGFDSKSIPLSGRIHQNKVMKRKKRKRVEEESDLKSYMSSHNIFSYYENKGRMDGAYSKDVRGGAIAFYADDPQEFGLNNVWSSLNSKDSDKSFEDMIQKIEAAESQINRLRSRADKVVNENPENFCFLNRSLLGLADGMYRSDLNPASPVGNNDPFPVTYVHTSSQLNSDYNMGDLFMPENAISSCEEMTPFLNETTKSPQLEVPWEDTKDRILLHNQAAEKDLHDHENIRNQIVEKIKVEDGVPNVKAYSTSLSNISRKTNKGKRKSGSTRRSLRTSG